MKGLAGDRGLALHNAKTFLLVLDSTKAFWHRVVPQACAQVEDGVVRQVEAEKDALLAQVRGQMSDMQRQHDHMASELQRKLAWYATDQCTCCSS